MNTMEIASKTPRDTAPAASDGIEGEETWERDRKLFEAGYERGRKEAQESVSAPPESHAMPREGSRARAKRKKSYRSRVPGTIFAPRSSRVVRWLLQNPEGLVSEHALSVAAGLNRISTGRLVRKMQEDGYLARVPNGKFRLRDADRLLQSWDIEHDLTQNRILTGYTPSRSGPELLNEVTRLLETNSVEHAATGLASAWLLGVQDNFQLATIYVREPPTQKLLDILQSEHELSFQGGDASANVWLLVPKDDGVFQGAYFKDGVRTVHPVQAYLDLAAHPENPETARRLIRRRFLARIARGG